MRPLHFCGSDGCKSLIRGTGNRIFSNRVGQANAKPAGKNRDELAKFVVRNTLPCYSDCEIFHKRLLREHLLHT